MLDPNGNPIHHINSLEGWLWVGVILFYGVLAYASGHFHLLSPSLLNGIDKLVYWSAWFILTICTTLLVLLVLGSSHGVIMW